MVSVVCGDRRKTRVTMVKWMVTLVVGRWSAKKAVRLLTPFVADARCAGINKQERDAHGARVESQYFGLE